VTLGSESSSVQRPFVRYAVEAGWTHLSPENVLALRNGGVTNPVLDSIVVAQLQKLNPKALNAVKAADVVNRRIVSSSGEVLTKFPRRVGCRLIGTHSKN
jgi:type I restriction enzyme R subunit